MTTVLALASVFSLVCSGSGATKMDGQVVGRKAQSATYQVDLGTGRWCVDSCPATFPIFKVTERVLTLDRSYDSNGAHVVEMNRRTGEFYDIGLMQE